MAFDTFRSSCRLTPGIYFILSTSFQIGQTLLIKAAPFIAPTSTETEQDANETEWSFVKVEEYYGTLCTTYDTEWNNKWIELNAHDRWTGVRGWRFTDGCLAKVFHFENLLPKNVSVRIDCSFSAHDCVDAAERWRWRYPLQKATNLQPFSPAHGLKRRWYLRPNFFSCNTKG